MVITITLLLILNYLKRKHHVFVSANDIMAYLIKQDEKIGLTTIYRVLNALEKEGKLRVEVVKNTRCFQYVEEECKNHFHLKCEKCGKIEHFDCEEVNDFCKHIGKEHGFMINPQNAIGGLCKKCQKKNKEGN